MEHDFKRNEMHVLVHLLVHTSSWPSGPSGPTEAPISSACKKLAVEFLLFLCNEDEDEKETIQRVHV